VNPAHPSSDLPQNAVVRPVNDLPSYDAAGRAGHVSTNLAVPKCALAIGAHPDDIEFGCGATLARWAAEGCSVHEVVLTDGAKGTWDPSVEPDSLAANRQDEQREALRRIGGVSVRFLGRPDGELQNGIREQSEVCRWIREVKPDVVLTHDPWRRYRLHPDHRNAGFIVTDALVAARDPMFFPDQGLGPHRPAALLLWEADVPNHVESAEGFVDRKVDALLAHASQYGNTLGIRQEPDESDKYVAGTSVEDFRGRLLTQLSEHARIANLGLGEAFHLMVV